MNTIGIITALIALLGGFAVGNFTSEKTPDTSEAITQNQERFMSEHPRAQDFVSLRPGISDLPAETLTDEERAGLLFMREEEKLARDVYQTLYEQWQLPIFANIAQSEQTHTEAVRELLEKYNLTDPADDTIGIFADQNLQKLYNDLTSQGKTSEVAALTVGATIEDLDIKDLQERIAQTDNQDIALVYENLLRGSRNHLRAFTKQLTQRGEEYEPQYMTKAEYESVVSSPQETGMGANAKDGNGGGMHEGNRGWGGRGR